MRAVLASAWIGAAFVYLSAPTSIYQSVIVLVIWSAATVAIVRWSIPGWIVAAAALPVHAFAVARHPIGTDLWTYHMVGRVVTEHGNNPFSTTPEDVPGDPFTSRVNIAYLASPSAYGPAFVAICVAVAFVSGENAAVARTTWQLIGVASVAVACLILRREGVEWSAVAAFALCPVTVVELVHLAHNDAVIGLLVLAGVVASRRDRHHLAAVILVIGALVKAPAAVALVVLIAHLASRGERRTALRCAGLSIAVALAAILPFGVNAVVDAMRSSGSATNATSIWNLVDGDWRAFSIDPTGTIAGDDNLFVTVAAVLLSIAIAVLLAWLHRDTTVEGAMTIALLATVVVSVYPSVWYFGWLLPLVPFLARAERVVVIAVICGYQVVTQMYLFPLAGALSGRTEPDLIDSLAAPALGLYSLAALASIVWLTMRRRTRLSPTTSTA